jgi:hypothetical protein
MALANMPRKNKARKLCSALVSVPARACLALCVAQLRSLDEAGLVQKHPCARHLCTHTHEKAEWAQLCVLLFHGCAYE